MDEIRTARENHRIVLYDRKSGQLTGVRDVRSFDLNEIVLETERGILTITGQDLHVDRLNLDKGEVDLDGQVDSMRYTDGDAAVKTGQGFLKRLLR